MQQWVLSINLSEYFTPKNDAFDVEWAVRVNEVSMSFYDSHNIKVTCINSMDEGLSELMRTDKYFVLLAIACGDLSKDDLIDKIKILRKITTIPIQISLIESKMGISEVSDLLANGADIYTIHELDAYSSIKPSLDISYSLIRRFTDYNQKEVARQDILIVNELLFLLSSQLVFYKSKYEIEFTPMEYKLLLYMAKNIGIVLPHSNIYIRIWGDEFCDDSPNAVWCQIRRIRDKLKKFDPKIAKKIKTIRGVGYRFEQ